MPMGNKVQQASSSGSQRTGRNGQLSRTAMQFIQDGRTEATRGLLHDFSNVMVGLCSLSENALDETEPGSPLHDDMEIIRDSAVRAQQLIRRISMLNGGDPDDVALIDLVSWLSGEVDTIRATLPKGSVVTLPDAGRTVLANVAESPLRDFLLTVTARFSKHLRDSRIKLELDVVENESDCVISMTFHGVDESANGGPVEALPGGADFEEAMPELARSLGASFSARRLEAGSLSMELALHAVVRHG
jgi:hypothetical protein